MKIYKIIDSFGVEADHWRITDIVRANEILDKYDLPFIKLSEYVKLQICISGVEMRFTDIVLSTNSLILDEIGRELDCDNMYNIVDVKQKSFGNVYLYPKNEFMILCENTDLSDKPCSKVLYDLHKFNS